MDRIQQEDAQGCGVACVAMVSCKSYRTVKKMLSWWDGQGGLIHYPILELLSAFGFSYIFLWKHSQLTRQDRKPWPPKPFADTHIVHISEPSHYVVWLKDGTVLDPAKPGIFSLDDYTSPIHIIGVYKNEKNPPPNKI